MKTQPNVTGVGQGNGGLGDQAWPAWGSGSGSVVTGFGDTSVATVLRGTVTETTLLRV